MSAAILSPDDVIELVRATLEGIDAPRVAPEPSVRARIVEAIEGPLRWAPFAPRVARLWDLPRAEAEAQLQRATRFDGWIPMPVPGMYVLPVTAGDRLQGAQAMFLRGDASTHFPNHEHLGEEHVLVLEGSFVSDDGRVARPGDCEVRAATSKHAFDVTAEGPCVCAYLLYGGFEILG